MTASGAGRPFGTTRSHTRQRDLCSKCTVGDHSTRHTKIGCIRLVGQPPADFVCRCKVPKVAE